MKGEADNVSYECKRREHRSKPSDKTPHERYVQCSTLGSGTYGNVILCWDMTERRHVAVKMFKSDDEDDIDLNQNVVREVAILKRCNHPHVSKILDTLFSGQKFHYNPAKYHGGVVMPFYAGGDLVRYAREHFGSSSNRAVLRPFPLADVRRLGRQLYDAMRYLHARSIIHRDIKPQNIMIDGDGRNVVLCDFGLGRMCRVPLGPTYTTGCCTLWYRPPDILLGSRDYGVEFDEWSMALVIAEMITGKALIAGDSDVGQLYAIFKILGTPSAKTWPGVQRLPEFKETFPKWSPADLGSLFDIAGPTGIQFMKDALVYEPRKRMSAKRALEHPFFAVETTPPSPPNDTTVHREPLRKSRRRVATSSVYPQRFPKARKRTQQTRNGAATRPTTTSVPCE